MVAQNHRYWLSVPTNGVAVRHMTHQRSQRKGWLAGWLLRKVAVILGGDRQIQLWQLIQLLGKRGSGTQKKSGDENGGKGFLVT